MTQPGNAAARTDAFRRPRGTRSRDPSSDGDAEGVSPEDAPKQCASCARPLTVGERMFYFLEGAEASPTCRACLVRQRGDGILEEARGRAPWDEGVSPFSEEGDGIAGRSDDLADRVRSFLQEEFDRIDLALDRLPTRHPDLPLLRDLHDEGQQELTDGRLDKALASLGDLRRIFAGVDRKGTPLSAPWDESVEELFDRVVARSRAMARRLRPPPEEDEAAIEPSLHGSSKATRASS